MMNYRQPRRRTFCFLGLGSGNDFFTQAEASLMLCWDASGFMAITPMIGAVNSAAASKIVFIFSTTESQIESYKSLGCDLEF